MWQADNNLSNWLPLLYYNYNKVKKDNVKQEKKKAENYQFYNTA
jgi:hypothetical protein